MIIRRGKAEGWLTLPTSALKPWAEFNGASFNGIKIAPIPGHEDRGSTVIAEREISDDEGAPLMVVPRDLILSLEYVERQAKSDHHLRDVLEALGEFGRTTRGAILTFLLMQATVACPDIPDGIGTKNPLSEYIKFLPEENLPTFWAEEEREILVGTSLKPAVEAKLKSLSREFEQLRTATESLSWCNEYWWGYGDEHLTIDDWKQVDAMYRSRALEFPGIGDCMVPCIDMANHSSGDDIVASYETNGRGDAVLLLCDGEKRKKGDEVTITYGDSKGACEMIFSYGFIEDSMSSARELFLDLDMPDDDPLKPAKVRVATSAPGFKVFDKSGDAFWESDYVWLALVNEEDGLGFRVLQTNDGGRELRALWKDMELEDTSQLGSLLQAESLRDVYQLRAVALLQDRVEEQLKLLYNSNDAVESSPHGGGTAIRNGPWSLTMKLRALEQELLERCYGDLDDQKTTLAQSETVIRYLQQMSRGSEEDEDFT